MSDGQSGILPLMLIVMCKEGGKVIGGGGPGGRIPSGRLNSQPKTWKSSHEMQRLKNQRLHGITVPPSEALGEETEVRTGNMAPAGRVDELLVTLGGGPGGVNVNGRPSPLVIVTGSVNPVGMVNCPPEFDMTVCPAALEVVKGSGLTVRHALLKIGAVA